MSERRIPGGALAVVKDRRLIYARGYGWSDLQKQVPVRAESLFRIASISKPITAVAILKLVEQGKLKPSDHAFAIVKHTPILADGTVSDDRLKQITIDQLLHHTGGWDRDKSFDPMFHSNVISSAAGIAGPADSNTIIRYMLGRKLDFAPNTRYAYSNFGYCVLGRVIEELSGMAYEAFVRKAVLAPANIRRMRIGASLRSSSDEVHYYANPDVQVESVFPGIKGKVPFPYGGFYLEAMDSNGGWLASAVDLARFAAALDDPKRSSLLNEESIRMMSSPPSHPVSRTSEGKLNEEYYGCGWLVRPVGGSDKVNHWHVGSLPGCYALLVRRSDGLSWAALFNQRSDRAQNVDNEIDPALHRAAAEVSVWPLEDLFPMFA